MVKTAIIYSPTYLRHDTGPRHPESASRLRVITRELNKSGILENPDLNLIEPKAATPNELTLIHTRNYIHQIRRFCSGGGGLLDREDTVASPESYEVALLAAGGALKAVRQVMKGLYRNAVVLCRPPGHHAGPDYPLGFCIFNNVAVAAAHLTKRFGLCRVLVIDIDAHHGNGTQEIFYNSSNVLYVSLHEDPIEFPLTGFATETGTQEGKGYTVNIPLPYGTDDKIYLKAFKEVALPVINQYRPEFVLVSAGFDNHYSDPIGNLSISAYSYTKIFEALTEVSSKHCGGKLVAVLEGGYSLRMLGQLACAATATLAGVSYPLRDRVRAAGANVRKKGEVTISKVKRIQSAYWNIN